MKTQSRAERPRRAGFDHEREPVYLDEGRSGEFQNLRKCIRLHFLYL